MATKLRVKKEDPKPTPQEIEAANKFAKTFAMRKGLGIGDNAHVGSTLPQFIDASTGLPSVASQSSLPPRTIMDINQVPAYVKNLEWDKDANVPYYTDEKTGDIQYVHPDIFHSTRFNPNRGKSAEMLIAKR